MTIPKSNGWLGYFGSGMNGGFFSATAATIVRDENENATIMRTLK